MITIEKVKEFLITNKDFELKSKQDKLSFPIIERLYLKMKEGIKFDNIKTCNGIIIDGHHRYICSKLLEIKLEENPSILPSEITLHEWDTVRLEHDDWDSKDDIIRHNKRDAEINNISIEKLNELFVPKNI